MLLSIYKYKNVSTFRCLTNVVEQKFILYSSPVKRISNEHNRNGSHKYMVLYTITKET